MIRVKRVDPKKNYDLLRQLQRECLPADKPLNPLHGYWWIAYCGDTAVGFAALTPSMQWSDTGYLCRAGVVELFQGQGIQKKLIRARMRYAKKLGWQYLISDTHQNPASSNSLISCGFKLYEPQAPWSFRDALYWKRQI